MANASHRDFPVWERHGQTIIASLILIAIVWVGSAVTNLNGTMGVVLNRLDTLDHKLASMDNRFTDYQTKAQARSERETQALQNQMFETRLNRIERQRAGD